MDTKHGWREDIPATTHELRQAVSILQIVQDTLSSGHPIRPQSLESDTIIYLAAQMGAHVRDLEQAIERMEQEIGKP